MAKLLAPMCVMIGLGVNSGFANAGEGDIGPVYLDSVSAIQVAGGGHQAGNLEVKIKGGFTVPAGVSCDSQYITTLRTVDSDKRLFGILTVAQVAKQPVYMHITDSSTYTAFPGRCSVMWATLAQ